MKLSLASLGTNLSLYAAYLWFRARHGFLRASPPTDPSKVVLIVSLTDLLVQVKTEGVFIKALQREGYTPVVVCNSTDRWAHRYFRAFGVTRFTYFNQMADAEALMSEEDAARFLRDHASFRSLLDATHDGIRIGNHVLSTAVRRLRTGSGDFRDPAVQALLGKLLRRSWQVSAAAKRLLEDVRPAYAFFLEKGYSPYGELFDAATSMGIPCVQYVQSQKSDALVFKRYAIGNRTMHPFSFSQRTWERVRALPWSAAQEQAFLDELKESYAGGVWFNRKFLLEGKRLKTPEEVRAQLQLDPAKKTAVIFSHVLWDATFFFGTTLFDDYEHWLGETVKVACRNTAVNWIIKVHPDYVWKARQSGDASPPRDLAAIRAAVGELPPHVRIVLPDTDISTYSFFAVTDYCITVRGTIGIEAPCFGIPVLTAGTGRYAGLGFTDDSDTREDYLRKLERIQDIPRLTPERRSLALRHAHALFTLRALPFHSFSFVRGIPGKRDDVTIRIRDRDGLRDAPDLRAFTQWLQSGEEDYLAVP